MNEAPRKRGRPAGAMTVHPDRDRLIHFAVEWVMLRTGLGIGRGVREPAKPDACVIAAWLLSGGIYRGEYLRGDPNRAWLIEAATTAAHAFQAQLAGVAGIDALLTQLRRVDHLTARRAYRSVQAQRRWRSSVRADVDRAEHTRRVLSGAPIENAPLMEDDAH